jgi:hypothetical protein
MISEDFIMAEVYLENNIDIVSGGTRANVRGCACLVGV